MEEKQGRRLWVVFLLVAALVVGDAIFISLSSFYYFADLHFNDKFLVWIETSYSEWFQHVKELLVIGLLLLAWWRQRLGFLLGWIAGFIYLFADDFFRLHEEAGNLAAQLLRPERILGLRAEDYGELSVYVLFGLYILLVVLKTPLSHRPVSWRLFLLVALVGVFAAGVDMVGSVAEGFVWSGIWSTIEDGGEMLAMTAVLGYAVWVATAMPAVATETQPLRYPKSAHQAE